MKLSEIASTLRQIRVEPVKTLGQNFLHDQNLARWIVERAELTPDDYVVEIGPGLGALTEAILASGARILAIEKDARLAGFLRERFPQSTLEVLHQDALEFEVRKLFGEPRVKLLANFPYYIASQLLLRFLHWPSPIGLALCMLQKEMARRLTAVAGTSDYGALSLLVQRDYRVEYLRTVPASVFLPQPDVDSAFVRLTPRGVGELPEHDRETFTTLVRQGFSQRRKQLQGLLRDVVEDWPSIADALALNPKARAEELTLPQWIALTNKVAPTACLSPAQAGEERFAIVDENDAVVGDAPRSEVHANNLRHRAVHILLWNDRGELFLQKRSSRKDRHPSVWDSSAAGHVDAGEEYDVAAHRELFEELGVEAPLERSAKLGASANTGQEFIWVYRAKHNGPFRLAPAEIEYASFFAPEIIAAWIAARPADFAPGFLECWSASGGRAAD